MARARPSKRDPKEEALARDGALNPRPEAVLDPLFVDNPFFDPRDLVQVRYEMVRRHQADGQSIRDAADVFGVSRPTFYKAQSALADQGLAGLLPQQRGPKGGHKISVEVIAFVDELKAENPDLTLPQVIGAIAVRFGLDVHRRSLERRSRAKTTRFSVAANAGRVVDAYERLRAGVVGAQQISGAGLATLRRQGMAAWIKASDSIPGPTSPLPAARRPPTAGAIARNELTLILASLVVTLSAEPTHAGLQDNRRSYPA